MASPRINYKEASREGSRSPDYLADGAAKMASRNLLVAQLKAGQHNLDEVRFWGKVRELRAEGAL